MRILFTLLVIGIGLWSCKKQEPTIPKVPSMSNINVEEVLKNWSANSIIPAYELYNKDASALYQAVLEFQKSPNKTKLNELKTVWKVAYLSWQNVAMYEFGPAADITLRGETNIYPTDTTKLKELIDQGSTNINGANKLDVKGFPAIDYLLFNSTEGIVLNQFTDSKTGANRLNYLSEVSKQISENASTVTDAWVTKGGNYSNQFNSAVGTDVGSSLGLIINTLTQHIERHLRDGKLGIPNGNRNFSGTALPGHVEAPYAGDISVELAKENLKAIEQFYLGNSTNNANGLGLDDYLTSLNASYGEGTLDDAIKTQFKECEDAIAKIPTPLKDNLISNKDNIDAAVKALQKLIVLFKADIPSATGILITYQDNDGD